MNDEKEWTREDMRRLTEMWADPQNSLSVIGKALQRSKNSIAGKAHRLNLPARPSPIKRGGDGAAQPRKTAPRCAAGPTLPALRSVAERAEPVVPDEPTPPQPVLAGRVQDCCWPIGEPGTKAFRFCGDASLPGRNYCQEHHCIAFVSPRALVRVAAPLPKIEAYAAANLVRVPPATGLQGLLVAVNKHRRGAGLIPFTLRAGADA